MSSDAPRNPTLEDVQRAELTLALLREAVADQAKSELRAVEHTLKRKRWAEDPALWARERLGVHIWSKQIEILESIRDNRRTAVQSAHEIGKSFTAALAVCWWLDTHKVGEAFVVTSAPTRTQVRSILWREIGRMHTRGQLSGRVNQTEWWMSSPGGKEELVAFGRKPDDYSPTAFQGIHARYVLYVFDEACGMPQQLWEAADSLIANDTGKALAIGNPDDPLSEFAQVCKPGSIWTVKTVSAFDSPNFTGEAIPDSVSAVLVGRTYVEEKRRKLAPDWVWAEDGKRVIPPEGVKVSESNPVWQSKVLGLFPENASGPNSLIPISWVRDAQAREVEPSSPIELGVDVGGGGNKSVSALRRGMHVRIVRRDHNPDTMETCGNVISDLVLYGAHVAKIDVIGIGRGVVDRGREQEKPFLGINVAREPQERERFINLRAEAYWHLRDLFQNGLIDIDAQDDDLAAQLVDIRFKRMSNGKIAIESKDEMRRRSKVSPDDADSVMLAMLPENLQGPKEIEQREASWG